MVFDAYGRYYDILYGDKDYRAESEYVAAHIVRHAPEASRILELGCGTGGHAEQLAKSGYSVHGIDLSDEMLARAASRRGDLSRDIAARLSFGHGDARTLRTGEQYDAVVSLFNVMGYQTSNRDLKAAFQTAAAHLRPGGLFLFDFWYGPAVLTQKPHLRIKRLGDGKTTVTRIADPVVHLDENVVDVNFTVFVGAEGVPNVHQLREKHRVRYFFLPELELCREGLFEEIATAEWMTDLPLSGRTWNAAQLLSRTG